MLNLHSASVAFLIVTLISVGAALFRTYAGPERARERRNIAYLACIKSGGEWLVIERSEVCCKNDAPLLLSWSLAPAQRPSATVSPSPTHDRRA